MQPELLFDAIDKTFLESSREWLEDPGFRRLILAAPVNQEAQEAWFASLPQRHNYRIWGLKYSQKWVGACGLKNIDTNQRVAEYWGYIYPPELRGRGLGRKMFQFLIFHAKELDINRLWLRVSECNNSAIIAYESWGFTAIYSDEPGVMHMELFL